MKQEHLLITIAAALLGMIMGHVLDTTGPREEHVQSYADDTDHNEISKYLFDGGMVER